jgi:hypothetical protein
VSAERTFKGLKVASERANAESDFVEVVQELMELLAGNRSPSTPAGAEPACVGEGSAGDKVEVAFVPEDTFELKVGAAVAFNSWVAIVAVAIVAVAIVAPPAVLLLPGRGDAHLRW